jgi:hypothetical protein
MRAFTLIILVAITATLASGCDNGFDSSTYSLDSLGTGGTSGLGRSDFTGIYNGTVGSSVTPTPFFSAGVFFAASDGSGFFYSADGSTTVMPNSATLVFSIFCQGGNQFQFSGNQMTFSSCDGYSFDSGSGSPNPRDLTAVNAAGTIEENDSLEYYARINGTAITNMGLGANLIDFQNTFEMTRMLENEQIEVDLTTLASLNWRSVGEVGTYGFNTNYPNIGDSWSITVDGSTGNIAVTVNEDAIPSGCVVSNGNITLLGQGKNEFAVIFDLDCNDDQLDGSYSGVGFIAETIFIGATYDIIFSVQHTGTSTKYLRFFGPGY